MWIGTRARLLYRPLQPLNHHLKSVGSEEFQMIARCKQEAILHILQVQREGLVPGGRRGAPVPEGGGPSAAGPDSYLQLVNGSNLSPAKGPVEILSRDRSWSASTLCLRS